MKTLAFLVTGSLVLALTATHGAAETDVEKAQKALKQAGHDPGPIDGVMGAKTSAALRAYQKTQGLGETGQLDEATSAKLGGTEKSPSAAPRAGSEQTGGDTKPNAVDPAQAGKTGANAGEGASYSRSSEKGQSNVSGGEQKK